MYIALIRLMFEGINMKKKSFEEIIDFDGELNIVEEFLNIDSSLIEMEKNKDLIRMEMNIVEFPIFSKNTFLPKNNPPKMMDDRISNVKNGYFL